MAVHRREHAARLPEPARWLVITALAGTAGWLAAASAAVSMWPAPPVGGSEGAALVLCGDGTCDASEINTCLADCPPSETCGDQICSAFERFETCPLDCDPPTRTPGAAPTRTSTQAATPALTPAHTPPPTPTRLPGAIPTPLTRTPPVTPTQTRTATSTATATRTVTAEPSRTSTERSTLTATPTPLPATAEISTPTGVSATQTASLTPEAAPTEAVRKTCQVVSARAISSAVVEALAAQTGGYRPAAWVVCDSPPDKVCMPLNSAIRDGESGSVRLWDCARAGRCASHTATALADSGDIVCAETSWRNPLRCAEGCAFAPLAEEPFEIENYVLPLLLVLVIVGGLALLPVLIITRRRRLQ